MRDTKLSLFLAFTLVGTLVLFALGSWQWSRRSEKLAFIARIAEAASRAPRPLAGAETWDRVTVTGRYRSEKTAYVRTSRPAPKPGERDSRGRIPVSGFGVMVMTVFETEHCVAGRCDSATILVNRGFQPTPPNGAIPIIETPAGPVTITGFLRPSEREGIFPPGNDPSQGIFFYRTTPDIARHLGLAGAFGHFLDRQAAEGENSIPLGIDVPDLLRAIPNNHLEYAITWWSLAATNLGVAGAVLLGRRRKRDETA